MERVQPPQSGSAEADAEKVPAARDPARLPGLIAQAQGTVIERDRLDCAAEINALLIAMRAPGNEAAEAKAVLAALDLEALHGLVDAEGKSCRAEAVETLLACGFPHALGVRPEDLEHRQQQGQRATAGQWVALGVGLTLALVGILTVLGNFRTALAAGLLVATVILPLVFLAPLRLQRGGKPKP